MPTQASGRLVAGGGGRRKRECGDGVEPREKVSLPPDHLLLPVR